MSNDVAAILDELRQDHRNMAILLDRLEHESEQFFRLGDPDFELVHDIMHYMTVYPDTVHHPKEDRIYAELKAARPDLSRGMSRVTKEHRLIAEQSVQLRDMFQQAIAGEFVQRNAIVADAMRYIESLRKHMHWEEKDLFRRVDRMVADGHTVIDASIIIRINDPLFGSQVEKRFERLLDATKQVR